ncbi:MAG TPA: Xaa-Pro peptidase family protein [Anaerolineae bacterium]|nr:Xaa-Pro peptidase family protein [Anaerolineae bacterium]
MSPVNQELEKARLELAALCDVALLSSLPNVTYVSGFEVPHAVGVSAAIPYAPPFAVFAVRDTPSWLAVSGFGVGQAKRESRLDHLLTFDALDSFNPTDVRGTFFEAARRALHEAGLSEHGTLGVESRALPYGLAEFITDTFPNVKLVEIDDALERARLTKTPREIELLRRAIEIGDVGQNTLRELAQTPGRNEFDMYAEIIARMQRAAGHEIPVAGELVSGPRTTTVNYPGGPQDRVTQTGDPVLMDISQRVSGYWSDVTNAYVVGAEPNAHQLKFARASQAAFEAAVNALRPGVRASDVWTAANAAYEKHGIPMPHYIGHQLGVTVNELPRIVPYDHTPIQANMVFALEPGAYEGPGGTIGVRSEKNVLVTANGAEIISKFDWGI